MKHPKQLVTVLLMGAACTMQAQRSEALLEKNWKFSKGDFKEASQPEFNDTKWESVVIPHDWAIFGPFDMNNDLQNVAVTQNFEKKASLKTGRTGGLPYVGTGWYRTSFDAPADKEVTLLFDGAMSEARVYINGKEACFWPFGYNSFHCNVTSLLNKDGKNNTLAVRLENRPQSSRWYPGAGLYRNVHLIVTDKIHVPVWGTQITTPHVNKDFAAVRLQTKIDNAGEKTAIRVETEILSPEGKVVTRKENTSRINHGQPFEQNFIVNAPELWSPESPSLYKAVSKIYADDKLVDTYTTRFGIRSIEYIADKGFYLNGEHRKFQGVCNHHDLGPLGAAINVAALRHQLTLLKDMGCDAIRTSHNMPTPELVALCDEMGFMMMIEPFDEWDIAKCENGYHRYFDEWAERDMINMLHNYRNNPCVVMWSIGNEVPTQCSPVGYKVAKFLQDICHREDPTRPVTAGCNEPNSGNHLFRSGVLDVIGYNYHNKDIPNVPANFPDKPFIITESNSALMTRGYYRMPSDRMFIWPKRWDKSFADSTFACSSYENCHVPWGNTHEESLKLVRDNDFISGQYVWTGFDYIGEPTPYGWPARSSYFGIVDLAGFPKDVYYLYQSEWTDKQVLHLFPHWNWTPGQEIDMWCYYNQADEVELFVNGKSQGVKRKDLDNLHVAWRVKFEPGTVKVIARESGKVVAEKEICTAGKPAEIRLTPKSNYKPRGEVISNEAADGKDLCFVTVEVLDEKGNLCPDADNLVNFTVQGNGFIAGVDNGNPVSMERFKDEKRKAFYGKCLVVIQNDGKPGKAKLTATSEGLRQAVLKISAEEL